MPVCQPKSWSSPTWIWFSRENRELQRWEPWKARSRIRKQKPRKPQEWRLVESRLLSFFAPFSLNDSFEFPNQKFYMSILWYFYIYRIWYLIWHPICQRDWWLTHSVTLALDVPGTIGSGELENRQRSVGISASLLLSGPIRKRIQDLLVLNIRIGRTNRPPRISLLRNKTISIRLGQLECVLSIWEIFQSRRSIDLRRRERANFLYLFQLNQGFVMEADSNNHFIRHAYFWLSGGFTQFH